MTTEEAEAYFGLDLSEMSVDFLKISGCGFEDNSDGWVPNDLGNFSGSFDFVGQSQLIQDLGLSGAKGYFDGYTLNSYQEKAEDILRGQKIVIFKETIDDENFELNSVSFPQSYLSTNTNETPAWAWVAVVLCVLLFIALVNFQRI